MVPWLTINSLQNVDMLGPLNREDLSEEAKSDLLTIPAASYGGSVRCCGSYPQLFFQKKEHKRSLSGLTQSCSDSEVNYV